MHNLKRGKEVNVYFGNARLKDTFPNQHTFHRKEVLPATACLNLSRNLVCMTIKHMKSDFDNYQLYLIHNNVTSNAIPIVQK